MCECIQDALLRVERAGIGDSGPVPKDGDYVRRLALVVRLVPPMSGLTGSFPEHGQSGRDRPASLIE